MPPIAAWFLLIGLLLVLMALAGSVLKRLPLSTSALYLLAGFLVGPHVWGMLRLHPIEDVKLVETLAEVAVLVSLFTTGLKMGPPLRDRRWWIPVRLAFGGMAVTVGLVTLAGVVLLGLPLGAAVLLGGILAPTDPVLASDVTVEHHEDRDRLRFGLSGEAGLNDGTAFPFVMLGLGLLGLHEIGPGGLRWLGVDVLWATAAGLGIGFGVGTLVARFVLYLRQVHREAVGLDEFLTLGLIALSYGVALLAHAYGFLAVFAAGLALRRIARKEDEEPTVAPPDADPTPAREEAEPRTEAEREEQEQEQIATDPHKAPTHLARSLLSFNEQLERIGAVVIVLLLGAMLTREFMPREALWFVPLLFFVVRPVAVWVSLIGSRTSRSQRALVAWFGIRGIGSVYYLMYAISHGLPEQYARPLIGLTFAAVAASVFAHGISVTPLMKRYEEQSQRATGAETKPALADAE